MPSPIASPTSRFNRLLPFIVLLVLPMLLLWRVVFLGEAFVPADLLKDIYPWGNPGKPAYPWNPLMWDGIAQFYPWRLFLSTSIHSGYLPLWNPHQFCGTPFAANSQSAIFYPLNAIFVLLPVKAAFGVSVILHLFLTGSFLYLFLRRSMNLARGAALIGAVTWQLCSWQVSWLELPTFLCVATWIPAVLLAIHYLSTATNRGLYRAALALGVSLGLMVLAGHLQICFYGFLLIAAYGIFRLLPRLLATSSDPSTRPVAGRIITAVVLAVSIALLLGLAQVLPAIELSRVSHRAGGHPNWDGYHAYVAIAVPVYQLVTLVLPQFYGNPTDGTYWLPQPQFYVESACYVGLAGLLIALAGTFCTWRSRPETRFFAIAAVISMLLAVGTPLNALLYFGVPGFAQSGSPGRILVLWSLCGAVLTAVGVQALIFNATAAKRRLAFTVAILCALAIAGIAVANLLSVLGKSGSISAVAQQLAGETNLWRLPLVVLLVTLGALYQFGKGKLDARRTTAILLTVVTVDLLLTNVGYNRTAKPDDVYPITPSIAYLQAHAGLERVMPVNSRWSLDPAHPPRAVLPPNAATVYGLYDTQGYDSLFPGQYMAFAGAVNGDGRSAAPDEDGNIVFTHGLTSPEALSLSPRFVMAANDLPASIPETNLTRSIVDGDVSVYENTAALPRFTLTPIGAAALQTAAPAPTQIELTAPVTAGIPETLVVRDQWYPGWHATVDGHTVPIAESPFVFRTLKWQPASTGSAHIEFKFQPTTAFAGIYLLCLGWSVTAGLAAFNLKRRTGKPT